MELRITHETRYDYASAVETAQHMAYLQPGDTLCQTVLSHQLEVFPKPDQLSRSLDLYGNWRCFFSLPAPHTQLRIVSTSEVRTCIPKEVDSHIPWEAIPELFRYQASARWNPAAEFSFASARAPRHQEFAAYAKSSFPAGRPALLAACDLMQRIHADFTYQAQSTEVHTPPLQALAQRKGVCQDFAHIMIACLRSVGLAARYVSGYLLTQVPQGQPRLIGSDASHAWVAVFIPDLAHEQEQGGWYHLDPTNDRHGWCTPGEDYVVLATGRDYTDVSPIRGVIHGGGQHTLSVAVTVQPLLDKASFAHSDNLPASGNSFTG